MSLSQVENEFEDGLNREENATLIEYLQKERPSAHSDMVELLVKSADGLQAVTFFCPDTDNYAYYLAHTRGGVVFAAALGLSALAYRLPNQAISGALAKGGELFKELGNNWVMFNPFWPERDNEHRVQELQHWCRLAYHHALALENPSA
ncbi:MAG TPA: hypothetical protein VFY78_01175 [Gammaproteobacteria bacterium]|jgi:hypothetical protein|nr:hypothetical protein [Gammaproteobacteria bacterium]